ncbi:hypothetical protein BJ875DRAFT_444874 [Amylocarpus encephaloides]|uniref:Uncharacterized protein n=1 Tax=Amylocarpus encephaloides TaxID=45428 RepID=A0A9P8C1M4_9HELO|nr:hypothetical protein BJ875DRAFT_444874 [Amylocarpus encephaloides]
MTQPDKRKRKRSKKVNSSVKEPTAVVVSKAVALDRPREVDGTRADAPPRTLVTESVDTPAEADRSSRDAAPITLANDIHSRCTDTTLVRRDIREGFTNVESIEFSSESASSEGAMVISKGGAVSAGQTPPVTDRSTPSFFTVTEHS